jgi:hypothetical protein
MQAVATITTNIRRFSSDFNVLFHGDLVSTTKLDFSIYSIDYLFVYTVLY